MDVAECETHEQGATSNTLRAKLNREHASFAFFLERGKELDATNLALAVQAHRAVLSSGLLHTD